MSHTDADNLALFMDFIFGTKDFELASVVHAVAQDIKFAGVRPLPEDGKRQGHVLKGKGTMYLILFIGEDKDGNNFDPNERIENIRKQYVNHELLVDPVALINSQRILRAAMHDSGPALRKRNDEH